MSKQFGFNIARSYDETFRRVRKMIRFDWAVINDDLWCTAFYENSSSQTSINNITGKQVGGSPFLKRTQQQHNPFPIAGPTVQSSVSADLNINVHSAQKSMPLSLAENGFQIMVSLPTPVKVNQLAYFLEGYDSNLKNNLFQGYTSGFKSNSSLDKNVAK